MTKEDTKKSTAYYNSDRVLSSAKEGTFKYAVG